MNDDDDEIWRELRRRIRTEGVTAAFEAGLKVLRDPGAAAPAKATVMTNMFRAGDMFGKSEDAGSTEGDKMTPEQLRSYLARMSREAKKIERDQEIRRAEIAAYDAAEAADSAGGVFD